MRITKNLASGKRPMPGLFSALCLLLLLVPLAAGCGQQDIAQATTPTPAAKATIEASAIPAVTAAAGTPLPTPAGTEAPAGTPTVRPTPTGAAPASPLDVLNIFDFTSAENNLVKRDDLQLDPGGAEEVLFTMTGPDPVMTRTLSSWVGVLTYDPVYREWNQVWRSQPITGTASPLPAISRAATGGYNGGDLLRTGDPILVARTTTSNLRAHLFMWRWDKSKNQAVPLKMVPAAGGAEQDAHFEADLDINVADLDGDGIYEVIADNIAGMQVWKWDGSKYVPRGGGR